MRRLISQRGDTLVEVTIALTILASIITAGFVLASGALRMGQAAKERTEVANLQQEQAEALRNFRDNSQWANFRTSLLGSATCRDSFHMAPSGDSWQAQGGALEEGFYTLNIRACRDSAGNRLRFDIETTWPVAGGGPPNRSVLTTFLVNLDD